MSNAVEVAGHRLRLLRCGEEYFPRLIAAVDGAEKAVYLETYIYASDQSARTVTDALIRAARRGVAVRLLVDGFGSLSLPRDWVKEMRESGVQVLRFRPQLTWFTLRRHRLRRLHRKLVVVDSRIAFVGGINIIDDTSDDPSMPPRLDYAVEIEGEVVSRIEVAMRRLWRLVRWSHLRIRGNRNGFSLRRPRMTQRKVEFVYRGSLHHRHDIERAYLRAIAAARHEILIANAYFLPGHRFRRALRRAARRGVRVVLMLQGPTDHITARWATLALYDELLGAGIEIYEYEASFMHAKVAVIDGRWTTVGSSNIDPFSLWLAREGNLVVRDEAFAAVVHASLMREIEHGSRLIRHSAWIHRLFIARIMPRISYAIVRVIIALVGYHDERDTL
ncbi:MAG TPA: cardiolipin synthase ClsB [Gallionellaceae bacterium]|nr:cardiolipin synthase ClsB [Gallionellaceae bacterium]